MAFQRTSLAEIKADIESMIGQRVYIRANPGRRKIIERVGTLEKTYPNHFLVRLDPEAQGRVVSYSYADILMDAVQLTPCEGVTVSAD